MAGNVAFSCEKSLAVTNTALMAIKHIEFDGMKVSKTEEQLLNNVEDMLGKRLQVEKTRLAREAQKKKDRGS